MNCIPGRTYAVDIAGTSSVTSQNSENPQNPEAPETSEMTPQTPSATRPQGIASTGSAVTGIAASVALLAAAGISLTIWRRRRA